ncbi:hypothetical protein VOLCADRAFT_104228 [Volvox carteri f. nagariensis]|uniref:PROP1-like PPR domain-containing protein n=1 Tax=Volvox carteri f. nagariensis TaxID=3068 RepID=D8TS80_VOLCA|nr:uncharacterized protein VOLCADRAFT_104228 [Volvox carteri f. nagariensis]EFJ49645.1 hypothetical protein VOLCADRAFT_104228 [Volvox carteri f. nagariensis]|eukprot:XP_002949152.1 hypothetical protein VOLCADRAFT_104228 [Volvox carteri f. nagariensis]
MPVVAKDTSRAAIATLQRAQHCSQLLSGEDSWQQRTPLTDKQLEDFSSLVLGSSSNVWSAEERNVPASTSYSEHSLESLVAKFKSSQSKHGCLSALKELTRRGELELLIRGLQELSKPDQEAIFRRWRYQDFLDAVTRNQKAKLALQFAKLAVPNVHKPALLTMSVLKTCAKCRDLDAGMTVLELARKHAVPIDSHMLTSLINAPSAARLLRPPPPPMAIFALHINPVCKAVGNVDKAHRVYLDMRAGGHRIDSHVYGALIATCAEAMKRDLTVMHERKDQYVLLERAFQYVADAEAAGVVLQAPVWNSLMVCAGRSGELNRAFEVLTMMQQRGISASATTYGSLIESCVCARQPEKALRVFEVALQKGFQSEVKIYTQALSACMLPLPHAWERAQDIYPAMQRASVRADKKFFACLMAVAGRCGRLDTSFELLTEMAAEGIRPSATTISAIIYACLERGNLALARRVYDLGARQKVYPVLSQFNRMMDVYASECRFGEVVSLLSDMVAAGRSPNLNTYRIIINACAFTDQAGLAFQVFALMHANKVQILQLSVAQAIYYMLIKACLSQTRFMWVPTGYPPSEPPVGSPAAAVAMAPSAAPQGHPHGRGLPAERQKEAERVLAALGAHKLRRGAHQSNPFDGPPDTIDWASHALSAFHHMLSRGFRPTLELLDCLLNCMRAMMLPAGEPGSPEATPKYVSPFVPLRSRNEVFEVAFEPRAFAILDEAIAKGLVPSYDPEAPMVVDMRNMPPVVAEVYVLHVLLTLERRARRRQQQAADSAEAPGAGSYHHSITLLVPPFDPDLVKWPSYVDRVMNRYTATMAAEERARLRHRSEYRRARARRRRRRIAAEKAAAEAAAAADGAVDDADGSYSDSDSAFGPLGGVASSSYDELEAVISGSEDDVPGAAHHDPWLREEETALGGGSENGNGTQDAAATSGSSGDLYVADSTTGLAVAATLQRMKVWMDMDYVNGTITVFAVEVTRWLKRRRQAAEAASSAAAASAGGSVGIAAGAGGSRSSGTDGAGGVDGGLSSSGGGLGSPAAGRGAAAMGMMAGSLAGALTSARMMGVGGMRSRGNPVEQQQRNIRLGMAAAGGSSSGGGGSVGRGASAASGPSHGPMSQQQQQQHLAHAASTNGNGATMSGRPQAQSQQGNRSPGNGSESAPRARPPSSARNANRPLPLPLTNGVKDSRQRAGATAVSTTAAARTEPSASAHLWRLQDTTAMPPSANYHMTSGADGHALNGAGSNGDAHHATTAATAPHQKHPHQRWRNRTMRGADVEGSLCPIGNKEVQVAGVQGCRSSMFFGTDQLSKDSASMVQCLVVRHAWCIFGCEAFSVFLFLYGDRWVHDLRTWVSGLTGILDF